MKFVSNLLHFRNFCRFSPCIGECFYKIVFPVVFSMEKCYNGEESDHRRSDVLRDSQNKKCEEKTMKKWISCLLALAMILTLFAGCGKQDAPAETPAETPAEAEASEAGIFYELTGIPAQKTVMTVSGAPVSAEEYLYWVAYLCASTEYNIINYNAYYGMYADLMDSENDTILWDGIFQNGGTVADYVRKEAESTIRFYNAIEIMAQKYDCGLDSADLAALASNLKGAIQEVGGQEAFNDYLAKLGITQDTFQDLASSSFLFDNLLELVLTEGTDLYLIPEKYDNYATFADHILLMTIDRDSGKPLSPEEIAGKKLKMEEILTQLQESDDPVTLFAQLADEYSEDPGRATNPTGYIYTPNTMVAPFEDAAAALKPGEFSGIVESDYGYHIILRRDLNEGLDANPEQRVSLAEKHLTTLLTILSQDATVELEDAVANLNIGEFYAGYKEKVKELSIAGANAAAAAAQAK